MTLNSKFVGAAAVAVGFSLTGCGGSQATDMSGYSTNSKTLDTSTVSSGTSLGASTLGVKLIPVQGKPAFVVGMNVPTFSGPADLEFGKNPSKPTAEVTYNPKAVTASLQDIASVGCNVFRIQLFTKLDGLKLDSNGLVTGLDETFMKNLSDMLAKAETNKIQVYVSLSNPWADQTVAKNPITDTVARAAFLKKAITPLSGNLRGRSCVFAVDVADEIESAIAGKEGNSTDKGATWDQARDYIKATLEAIKAVDPQRLVSSASGLHGWQNVKAGKFSKLGLDFYDFHLYDDLANIPPVKDLKVDRPVLIGSCGQQSKKVDNELQAKSDIAFLTNSLKQGYAGALIADYSKDADNAQSVLDKEGKHHPVLAQLQSFIASIPMNSPSTTAIGK